MIRFTSSFISLCLLITICIQICGCSDDKKCDANEPMVIDFKLVEENGKRKLVNLSEPACQIKKVKWDFDGDGTHDSEAVSPEIPANLSLAKITLMINGLNEITKSFSEVSEPLELVVDFLMPSSAKVGEEIAISSLSAPADLVKDLNWSFGDDRSNTENKPNVYHAYDKSGTYNVELCVNYDNCKNYKITISENPALAQKKKNNQPTEILLPDNQRNTDVNISAPLATVENEFQEKSVNSQTLNNTASYNEPDATPKNNVGIVDLNTVPKPMTPAPVFSVRIKMPLTAEVGQTVSIEDNSTVTNGKITDYSWLIDGIAKSSVSINHTFKNPGDYEIQLCLNGTVNCTKRTIRIKEKYIPPVYQVDFSIPASVVEGDRVELISNSSANVEIKSYTWTIGGKSKSGAKVFHVFTNPGEQKIKLCLDDRDCKSKIINVKKKEVPVVVREEIVSSEALGDHLVADESNKTVLTKDLNPPATPSRPIPEPVPVSTSVVIPPKTPAPPEKPMVEEESPATIIIPEDDDFYAKNASAPRPAFNDCGKGDWTSGSTIRFTPKQKMTLHKAVVYANGNGEIEFKLGYSHNGIVEEIPVKRNVNAGRSELFLNKFYITLYPGLTYTLILSTKTEGLKIRNLKPCGDADKGDDRLEIQHKSGYCLFELQYKY